MNLRRCEFSATRGRKAPWAAAALLASLAGGSGFAAPAAAVSPGAATQPATQMVPPEVIKAAEQPAPYPTFASIPPAPTGNLTPAQWKAQVVATRRDGAHLTHAVAQLDWTLADTEAWGERERAAGEPPPPITTPFSPATQAQLAALRAQASAPPRSR